MSEHVKAIIERILVLRQQQDDLGADVRDVYAEAKSMGFDKTALGQAVTIIRKRQKDPASFVERAALVDLYLAAFEDPSHAHTRAREAA